MDQAQVSLDLHTVNFMNDYTCMLNGDILFRPSCCEHDSLWVVVKATQGYQIRDSLCLKQYKFLYIFNNDDGGAQPYGTENADPIASGILSTIFG